jgi:hypothetical protein
MDRVLPAVSGHGPGLDFVLIYRALAVHSPFSSPAVSSSARAATVSASGPAEEPGYPLWFINVFLA